MWQFPLEQSMMRLYWWLSARLWFQIVLSSLHWHHMSIRDYHIDITWASETWLLVQWLLQDNIKENNKAPYHWIFAKGNHQWIPLTNGRYHQWIPLTTGQYHQWISLKKGHYHQWFPSQRASTISGFPSQRASTITGFPSQRASIISGFPTKRASAISGFPSHITNRFPSQRANNPESVTMSQHHNAWWMKSWHARADGIDTMSSE